MLNHFHIPVLIFLHLSFCWTLCLVGLRTKERTVETLTWAFFPPFAFCGQWGNESLPCPMPRLWGGGGRAWLQVVI